MAPAGSPGPLASTPAGVTLSVVIVSFNTRRLLQACLDSISEPEAEVIVVDNASSDGSVEMVRSSYPAVRLIALAENSGFARASNAGIRVSNGRYIVLLNSDADVLDHALAKMARFLDEQPGFAALGPLLLNRDGSVQTSCFAFTTVRDILFEQLGLTSLFPSSPLFNRRGLGSFDRAETRPVDWVSGACLMVRRSALQQVGLLDEGFFMYGEELDWCRRMRQAGLQVAFYPGARVLHYGRGSSARGRGALAPRALAGRLRYFRIYYGRCAVLAVRLLTAIGSGLRLLTLPLWAIVKRRSMRADAEWYWGLLRASLLSGGSHD